MGSFYDMFGESYLNRDLRFLYLLLSFGIDFGTLVVKAQFSAARIFFPN